MNSRATALITFLLTAAVSGGGVYFWQQNEIKNVETKMQDLTTTNADFETQLKSLAEEIDKLTAENKAIQEAVTVNNYINSELGYTLNLPNEYEALTEGYDSFGAYPVGTVWFGPESDFGTDGVYVKPIDDLATRISEIKEKATEVTAEETVNLNGISATKITTRTDIGYSLDFYLLQGSTSPFEIEVKNDNLEAQAVAESFTITQ